MKCLHVFVSYTILVFFNFLKHYQKDYASTYYENNTLENSPLNCVVVIVVLMINNWIWSSPNPHDLYGVMLQAQRGAAKDDSLLQEAEK